MPELLSCNWRKLFPSGRYLDETTLPGSGGVPGCAPSSSLLSALTTMREPTVER
jgi:hypothetical protein